jgi:DNA primase
VAAPDVELEMSVVDEIKQRLDIADVVSDFVALKKSGRNFKGLCPFHTEKTPSFYVFPERQSWHCFGGCATGGDVFSFVMKKEGLDFGQALKLLAQRANVSLPTREKDRKTEDKRERLYQINEAATRYYHERLLKDKASETARRYLEKRGVSPASIEAFQLGFSLDAWDALGQHLLGQGYNTDELVAAGLVRQKEGGKVYDVFRNRLMFPIRNEWGRVIGFGARALDDSLPKYLNSPQTAMFDKSGALYGIDLAKEAIRAQGQAIIVEGYMDAIIAHQYGIANVIASMGTSITLKQMELIKGFTRNLALALDADAAGDAATLRGLETARQAFSEKLMSGPDRLGFSFEQPDRLRADSKLRASLKIIELPQGKDPDEVIAENVDNWRNLVDKATSLMDYIFAAVTAKLDLSREEDRTLAVERLLPLIAETEDALQREHYLKTLAALVKVEEKTLLNIASSRRPTRKEKARGAIALPPTQPFRYHLEEYCLCLLLQHPELKEKARLLSEHFEGTENRQVFLAWQSTPDAETLRLCLDVNLHHHLDSLLNRELPPSNAKELEKALIDSQRRLEERRLRSLKVLEEALISEAESDGDKNVIKEPTEMLLQKALGPSDQLRNIFLAGSKPERKGAQQ